MNIMNTNILYMIGLVLVCLYLCTGIDDFIWDIVTLIKRRKNKEKIVKFEELDSVPPKLLALVIAAWHEDNVLMDVVENIIESQQYPKSMYHIFLGVYPNDEATVYIAKQLQQKYPNVHCVINYKEGPTTKAQNINYVISQIKAFEQLKEWKFASVTIHDSEDLVHPNELKVTSYLLETHAAMQFPVFPLMKKPTLRNYFSLLTTSTYADEFAENHFITMVSRRDSGAFVPSAGTGFALRRDTIDVLGYHVLPENSLTEDYKLSLSLYENGLQMYYVLEKLERVDFEGKIKSEFIATRSIFPSTFKTAVKQKTRWTLGITMQSLKFKDIFSKHISFAGKYSLYRDQKAKLGNLLSMVGYPVLVYFITSLFIELPVIYPKYSLSWYLCVVVTIMMLERQLFRGVSLKNVYGFRSMFFGCLFPPLLPFRIIWGNIINLVATIKAYIQYFKGKPKETTEEDIKEIEAIDLTVNSFETSEEELATLEQQEFEWSKTDHSFLEKGVLTRFHRKFGDILISKAYITAKELKEQLEEKKSEEKETEENTFIGAYLVKKEKLNEVQLMDALATLKNIPLLQEEALKYYQLSDCKDEFDEAFLRENKVLPLFKTEKGYVMVYGATAELNLQSKLREQYTLASQAVVALDTTVYKGIELMYGAKETLDEIELGNDNIDEEQLVIVRNYSAVQELNQKEIAQKMGICTVEAPVEEANENVEANEEVTANEDVADTQA